MGVDAIGINFHRASPRFVSIEMGRRIIAALPAFVTPVALFVDSPVDEIRRITDALNLRHVQLHGSESPQIISQLADLVVIKAIHVRRDELPLTLASWKDSISSCGLTNFHGLLLESDTAAPGGTGVENDWPTIARAQLAGHFKGLPPIIAAGGLNPQNVSSVIRMIRPWAVDVSSGIESQLGIKFIEKMQQFVAAVREADTP